MIFDVEVVLRERNYAVTERVHHAGAAREWTEGDVETVLKEILLAIDRVKNPGAENRYVALRGFSLLGVPRIIPGRGNPDGGDRGPDGDGNQ